MNGKVNMCIRRLEHSLNIISTFRNSGPGSLSLTTTWNKRSCTMSYMPTRCSGISLKASSCCIVTFRGSHCLCGQSEMSMSKPSSCAVGGRVRARSRSQILWGSEGLERWICLTTRRVCCFERRSEMQGREVSCMHVSVYYHDSL